MTITYKIKDYKTDPDDALKTMVGFIVTDEKGRQFLIDKKVTTGSNTKEQIITAAHTASQTEVNDWIAYEENIGKTWNPDTNTLE